MGRTFCAKCLGFPVADLHWLYVLDVSDTVSVCSLFCVGILQRAVCLLVVPTGVNLDTVEVLGLVGVCTNGVARGVSASAVFLQIFW